MIFELQILSFLKFQENYCDANLEGILYEKGALVYMSFKQLSLATLSKNPASISIQIFCPSVNHAYKLSLYRQISFFILQHKDLI